MNAVEIIAASHPRPPVLFSCEHASPALPAEAAALGLPRALRNSHWAYDRAAATLTRDLARRFGAPAVLAAFSRLWIDPNRHPDDPELLVREVAGYGIRFNAEIDAPERSRRLRHWYGPYHRALAAQISNNPSLSLLVSIHTFTRRLGTEVRPFLFGVLHQGRTSQVRRIVGALRASGREVRENEPYSGFDGKTYSIASHGAASGLPWVELEIRDDCTRAPTPEQLEIAIRAATL